MSSMVSVSSRRHPNCPCARFSDSHFSNSAKVSEAGRQARGPRGGVVLRTPLHVSVCPDAPSLVTCRMWPPLASSPSSLLDVALICEHEYRSDFISCFCKRSAKRGVRHLTPHFPLPTRMRRVFPQETSTLTVCTDSFQRNPTECERLTRIPGSDGIGRAPAAEPWA